METKDVIFELRTKKGLSQDELADKVFVTRQAVSRWEKGETTPNIEALKLLSNLFGISINTLLGAPRQVVCQECEMPSEDISRAMGGEDAFDACRKQLIDEFNGLHIAGMPKVETLHVLAGDFVNLEYILPNGKTVKFLDDGAVYLGNQLVCEFDDSRCFGVIANMEMLLVCTYGENGADPELVLYQKR